MRSAIREYFVRGLGKRIFVGPAVFKTGDICKAQARNGPLHRRLAGKRDLGWPEIPDHSGVTLRRCRWHLPIDTPKLPA